MKTTQIMTMENQMTTMKKPTKPGKPPTTSQMTTITPQAKKKKTTQIMARATTPIPKATKKAIKKGISH